MTSRSRQTRENKRILALGIILVVAGIGFAASVLDWSHLFPFNLTYKGPLGEFTIDSFSDDEEQRVFIGIVIIGAGLYLIKIGK